MFEGMNARDNVPGSPQALATVVLKDACLKVTLGFYALVIYAASEWQVDSIPRNGRG